MSRSSLWLRILAAIFAIFLIGYLSLLFVRRSTQPGGRLWDNIGTQVAQFLNPTPTILPDPVTIINQVQSLARLETIRYTVEKVIVAETGQGPFGFLFGDRLLLIAHGMVVAGVDLGQISKEDIWFDELGRVHIVLPESEVFVATLDNDKSYVYDRDTGFLTKGDVNLEATARQAAEDAILNAALEDGILEQATLNAESYLYGFLRSLQFQDVIFAEQEDRPVFTPSAVLTPTP